MIIGKRDKEAVRDLVYGNTMLKKQIEWLRQEIKVLSQIEDELKADNKSLRDENRGLKEDLELQREEHERWTKHFNEKMSRLKQAKPQYDFYPDFTYCDTDGTYIAKQPTEKELQDFKLHSASLYPKFLYEELGCKITDEEHRKLEEDAVRRWKDEERLQEFPDFTEDDIESIYISNQPFDELSEDEEAYIKSDIDLVNEIIDNNQTPNEMFDEILVESAYKILDSDYKDKYERAREAFLMVNDQYARTIGLHAVLNRILNDNKE